jgi:PadR family transcriptional regulator, regulatory protein PadR
MRMTHPSVDVAMAIMSDPDARHYGYGLLKASGVRSGVLYPMLSRMVDEGLLTDDWEPAEESVGRPRRRYYELTDKGRGELGAMLHAARSDRRFARLFRTRQPGAVWLSRLLPGLGAAR